jgi:hypothetical protein
VKSRSFRIRFSTNWRLRSGAERYERDGPGRRSISSSTAALVSFLPLYVAITSVVSTVAAPDGAAFAASPSGFSAGGAQATARTAAGKSRRTLRVRIGGEA